MRKIIIRKEKEKEKELNSLDLKSLNSKMNVGQTITLYIKNIEKELKNEKYLKEFNYLLIKYKYEVYLEKNINKNIFKSKLNVSIKTFNSLKDLEPKIYNFSNYKRIYHIGDIHAFYNELMCCFFEIYNPNYLYIFTGDYIDKGYNNVDTLKFLINISKMNNVLFLEGNHDKSLHYYALNIQAKTKFAFKKTYSELENSDIKKADILTFTKKLKEILIYKYNNKKIIVTHAGLRYYPTELNEIKSNVYIAGDYSKSTNIDYIFNKNCPKDIFQIHGHSNYYGINSMKYKNSINIDGLIDVLGNTTIVVCLLNKNGFKNLLFKKKLDLYFKNYIF